MRKKAAPEEMVVCQICHQKKLHAEVVPAALVRAALVESIRATHPATGTRTASSATTISTPSAPGT